VVKSGAPTMAFVGVRLVLLLPVTVSPITGAVVDANTGVVPCDPAKAVTGITKALLALPAILAVVEQATV
jgi:hypothetical protein